MSFWLRPLSVSAILCPADHHGRSDHGHGPDAWSHSRRLSLAHVNHHCGRRQSRLHRYGDSGRRWRAPEVYHGRTGRTRHCAVCALQKVPEREWKTSLRSLVHSSFGLAHALAFSFLGPISYSSRRFLRSYFGFCYLVLLHTVVFLQTFWRKNN